MNGRAGCAIQASSLPAEECCDAVQHLRHAGLIKALLLADIMLREDTCNLIKEMRDQMESDIVSDILHLDMGGYIPLEDQKAAVTVEIIRHLQLSQRPISQIDTSQIKL